MLSTIMHYSSIFLQRQSNSFNSLHHRLLFLRFMGGGPRTFPGGLNKWQWKRLHEKKAREKEKRLLDQEKQLYQARLRSQIRAKVSASLNHDTGSCQIGGEEPNYTPLSPQEHIKALADRFMKEGAEDLWNEDDGPIKTPTPLPKKRVISEPTDLNKIVSSHYPAGNNNAGTYLKSRNFSSCSTAIIGLGFHSRSCGGYSIFNNNNVNLIVNFNLRAPNFLSYSTWTMGLGLHHKACSGDEILNVPVNQLISKLLGYGGCLMRQDLDSMYGIRMAYNSLLPFRCYSARAGMTVSKRPKRFYFANDDSSTSEDASDSEGNFENPINREIVRTPRYERNRSDMDSSNDKSDEEEDKKKRSNAKRMISSAALGKHDITIKKRIPLKFLEDEEDLSHHMERIREEVSKRTLEENAEIVTEDEEETIYSSKRFDEYNISPLTVKALTMAGYMQMTRVQEATLTESLQGKDALVKAKAGTGKSIAFLLPAIETVLKSSSTNGVQRIPPVCVLILCPTRELASQIAAEATVLLKYHEGIGVLTLVGGTRFKVDQKRLDSDPCQIIVATPGRLLDHVENKSSFSARLMSLKMLILDEADHLLDLGFRKDLEKIVDCLPRQRQTLLFSATVPKEVRRVSQLVLKREHAFVDTVGYGLETPAKVKQFYVVGPHDEHLQMVYQLLKDHISQEADYKVIIFCTTANVTSLLFTLLREMKMNVREIHSRKPQLYRTRVSDEFKESKRLVLVTSEVSARGMNYPDVTLVIQVGVPIDREQYIHRVGRTGRKGQDGQSIILLAPWERYFLDDDIKDIPLEERTCFPEEEHDIKEYLKKIDIGIKEGAYLSWLGYYNSIREISRDKTTLVELANEFCKSIGLSKAPAIRRKTVVKMGLRGIPGIRKI